MSLHSSITFSLFIIKLILLFKKYNSLYSIYPIEIQILMYKGNMPFYLEPYPAILPILLTNLVILHSKQNNNHLSS